MFLHFKYTSTLTIEVSYSRHSKKGSLQSVKHRSHSVTNLLSWSFRDQRDDYKNVRMSKNGSLVVSLWKFGFCSLGTGRISEDYRIDM